MKPDAAPAHARLSQAVATAWLAYLLVLPFHRVWTLPWLGGKLQPPEVAFVGLAAVAVMWAVRHPPQWRMSLADLAAVAWLAASVVSYSVAARRSQVQLTELIGTAYLVCLYLVVRVTATPDLLQRWGLWFGYAAASAAALGVVGGVLSHLGVPSVLSTPTYTPVPYLGHSARATALTAGPQMLASILLLASPLFVAARLQRRWRRVDTFLLLLLALGLVATLSKTALCLLPAAFVLWALTTTRERHDAGATRRGLTRIAVAVSLGVALLLIAASRVIVVRDGDVAALRAAQIVAGEPWARWSARGDVWALMPTTYYFNNLASVYAILSEWPIGLGPAGQPGFTSALQEAGRIPSSMWLIEPHSTYLGAAAELGLGGLAALALILVSGGAAIRRLLRVAAGRRWLAAAYAGAGVAFLIEATSTDLMNCRHYWFFFAVVSASDPGRIRLPDDDTSRRGGGV